MKICTKKDYVCNTDHILQQAGGIINKNWVLLDSQSTVKVLSNAKLLTNIRRAGKNLEIYSNGGSSTTDLIGKLAGFKAVWYQPDGIANILSLASVQEEHYVTYNSQHGNNFMVEK
eukprot:14866395-Ditylum_brightwellii.AAC.1